MYGWIYIGIPGGMLVPYAAAATCGVRDLKTRPVRTARGSTGCLWDRSGKNRQDFRAGFIFLRKVHQGPELGLDMRRDGVAAGNRVRFRAFRYRLLQLVL